MASVASAALVCAGSCLAGCHAVKRPARRVSTDNITQKGHRFVQRPDDRLLEYTVVGPDDGVAVLHLPGFMCSAAQGRIWEKLATSLRVRVITPSFPGFGLSDCSPSSDSRKLHEFVDDVATVMDQEGCEQFHILSVSSGCSAGAMIAREMPERVLNVLFGCPASPEAARSDWAPAPVSPRLTRACQLPVVGDIIAWFLARCLSSEMRMSWVAGGDLTIRRLRAKDPDMLQEVLRAQDDAVAHTHRGVCDNLGSFMEPPPVNISDLSPLCVSGRSVGITLATDDWANPPYMQQRWKEQLPDAVLIQVPAGYGHFQCLPAANQERLLEFLLSGKVQSPLRVYSRLSKRVSWSSHAPEQHH